MERDTLRNIEIQRKPERTDVVIVGGGLSGLTLSQELNRRGIDHLVLEASTVERSPSIHYLTSPKAAETLGLEQLYYDAKTHRQAITGYTRYDGRSNELTPLEHLEPNTARDGFVTFSLQELRIALGNHPNILNATPATEFESTATGIKIGTRNGHSITAKLVIDATGTRANVYQRLAGENPIFKNRIVRACYGGVYPYFGPEDRLLFIDRFPQKSGMPEETAGWIMPLGQGKAEVVVGYETKLCDVGKWQQASVKMLLSEYIDWFNQRGIQIDEKNRLEVISGTFSQGLVNYLNLPKSTDVALFGESLGLNHPLNGYLIRNIAEHASTMADQIELRLTQNSWDPHNALLRNSAVNYGPQVVLSKRKQNGSITGNGRTEATKPIQKMLIDYIGEEELWAAIDEGVRLREIVVGLLSNFNLNHAIALLDLAVGYAELLAEDPIYRHEFKMKIGDRLLSR